MKSELNSFDSNIQSFTGTSFTGTYEPVKENKYVVINIYTDVADILTIYYTDNPNSDLTSETYNILTGPSIITTQLKSRFIKIQITTNGDTSAKRIYDVNLNYNSTLDVLNTRGEAILWNSLINVVQNGTYYSNICNISNKKTENISIYGTSSIPGSLILQYSNDGITFYDTQYNYNIP